MTILLISLAIDLLFAPCCEWDVAQTTSGQIVSEYAAPPPNLRSMVDAVDLVARVEVIGAQDIAIKRPSGHEHDFPMTDYELRVLEVFKAKRQEPRVGSTINVGRSGGVKLTESGFSQFSIGVQYVMFLRWSATFNCYVVAWGPDGVYDVHGRALVTEGTREIARQSRGSDSGVFVKELRSLQ